MIRAHSSLRNIAAALIVLALAMRVLVPSGWMPSAERGFALTICTGMDTQTVWMDKSGKLHKEDPAKGKSVEHSPCAFAGAAAPADLAIATLAAASVSLVSIEAPMVAQAVSVGHGLAAPPPPSIGPPVLI